MRPHLSEGQLVLAERVCTGKAGAKGRGSLGCHKSFQVDGMA